MDARKLKEVIEKRNTTIESVAKAADMDRSTFYRKMQPESKGFTVAEAKQIAQALSMSMDEANAIFYA